jgi:hypothetical protein
VAAGYTITFEAELLAMLDYLCNVDQSRLAASHLRSWILTGVTTPGMFRCEGLEGEDGMCRPEYCLAEGAVPCGSGPTR